MLPSSNARCDYNCILKARNFGFQPDKYLRLHVKAEPTYGLEVFRIEFWPTSLGVIGPHGTSSLLFSQADSRILGGTCASAHYTVLFSACLSCTVVRNNQLHHWIKLSKVVRQYRSPRLPVAKATLVFELGKAQS